VKKFLKGINAFIAGVLFLFAIEAGQIIGALIFLAAALLPLRRVRGFLKEKVNFSLSEAKLALTVLLLVLIGFIVSVPKDSEYVVTNTPTSTPQPTSNPVATAEPTPQDVEQIAVPEATPSPSLKPTPPPVTPEPAALEFSEPVMGSKIDVFRQQYGQEKSVVDSSTPGFILDANFGRIKVSFFENYAQVISNADERRGRIEDALGFAKGFLPDDAVVVRALSQELARDPSMDKFQSSLVETYYSQKLADVLPDDAYSFYEGEKWQRGSIKISIITDASDSNIAAGWSLSTDPPEDIER
jgi:hypothetical protein